MISRFKYQEARASGGRKHLRNKMTHIIVHIELDGGNNVRIYIKIDYVVKYCRRAVKAMYGNYVSQSVGQSVFQLLVRLPDYG